MMPADVGLRLRNGVKDVLAGLVHIHIPFGILALNAVLQTVGLRPMADRNECLMAL